MNLADLPPKQLTDLATWMETEFDPENPPSQLVWTALCKASRRRASFLRAYTIPDIEPPSLLVSRPTTNGVTHEVEHAPFLRAKGANSELLLEKGETG